MGLVNRLCQFLWSHAQRFPRACRKQFEQQGNIDVPFFRYVAFGVRLREKRCELWPDFIGLNFALRLQNVERGEAEAYFDLSTPWDLDLWPICGCHDNHLSRASERRS